MSKILVVLCIAAAAIISGCKSDDNSVTPQPGQNKAPNTPSTPKPPDGAVNVSRPVIIEWECSDPDSADVLKYYIYFGTDNPPATIIDSIITATDYGLGMLSPMTKYYWKIIAKDNKGASTAGPVWNFTTEN